MRQTTLSVPLEVKPESCAQLTTLVDALRTTNQPAGFPDRYQQLSSQTPALHFMSLSVFPHASFDPLFVLEANFDGPPGVFWGQLETALGPELREMLRCCKRPLDGDGPLYDAVTAPGSRAPVAPYFEARTQRPSVFHHGNRGLSRDRILAEGELFRAIRAELQTSQATDAGLTAEQVHKTLRGALTGSFPWLGTRAPKRISAAERLADFVRLALFAVAVLAGLSLLGLVLGPTMPRGRYVALMVGLAVLGLVLLLRKAKARPGEEAPGEVNFLEILTRNGLLLGLLLLAYVIAASVIGVLPVSVLWGHSLGDAWAVTWRTVAWGLLSIPATAAWVLLWLRWLERRDSSQDEPHVAEQALRGMVRREDWIAQNHMSSIVLLKPGVLRAILVHAGHLGLGLVLRVTATHGRLGSMRTVHFAHWAFVNNASRLMFLSNFDHSWDSYLDDFIEKAHGGLTLAWGAGVGFPPTRFLVLDGASHGRQFKTWALASRTVSRFWYSAYRDFTVDQIERHARIAEGLRKPSLSTKEAARWLQDL